MISKLEDELAHHMTAAILEVADSEGGSTDKASLVRGFKVRLRILRGAGQLLCWLSPYAAAKVKHWIDPPLVPNRLAVLLCLAARCWCSLAD